MRPLARPSPAISAITTTGEVAHANAQSVSASAATPGSITGRKPKRSLHPPTTGRRIIDTPVDTEKSIPTWALLPPRATRCMGSVVLSR